MANAIDRCPACGSERSTRFFSAERVPVFCNVLYEDAAAARRAATGAIELAHCSGCDLIFNAAFDPDLVAYAPGYENTLHHSPYFRSYADSTAADLIERHDLRERRIIDIGCGRGEFLRLLCERGNNRGVGYDPSYDGPREPAPRVRIMREQFQPHAVDAPADFICCRHVLEHIARPLEFLTSIRSSQTISQQTVLFFEVPNGLWTIRDGGVWDVIYEHCTYFVPRSLRRLFERAGFDVLRTHETYGSQFLTIEAKPAEGTEARRHASTQEKGAGSEQLTPLIARFAHDFDSVIRQWRDWFDEAARTGRRIVAWGGGSKGVMFCNYLDLRDEVLPAIVDLNPAKHGRFVPRTAQRIIAPNDIQSLQPDMIVVMNPLYRVEIESMLNQQAVSAEIVPATADADAAQLD